MKLAVIVTSLLLAAGGYLVARYGDASVLREGARWVLAWEASEGRKRAITRSDIETFPEVVRPYVTAQCFNEGGWPVRSCYQEAVAWMRDSARQHEERQELGFVVLGAGALIGVSLVFVARRRRRLATLLR